MEIVKYARNQAFLKIKAWYLTENNDDIPEDKRVTLSEKENAHKDRLVHMWSLRLNNKYSRTQVIQITMREHKVSQATAYRDYVLAMQLFGDLDQVNLAAERMILAESYWNLYQMALKKGNENGARKALDSYKGLFNWEDNEQVVDPRKLEASVYKMNLPRGAAKILNQMMESGSVDFNLSAEDAEWREVDDDELSMEDEQF